MKYIILRYHDIDKFLTTANELLETGEYELAGGLCVDDGLLYQALVKKEPATAGNALKKEPKQPTVKRTTRVGATTAKRQRST